MRRILYLTLTASMIAGCSQENDLGDKSTEYEVKITSGIASRASGSTWRADDRVGIYMLDSSADTELRTNVEYRNIAPDAAIAIFEAVEPSEKLYYPDGTKVDFVAYYPYNVDAQPMNQVRIDLSNQNKLPAIDLMIAKIENVEKTNNVQNFIFKHCLSNVKLTIKAGNGLTPANLEGMKVRIVGTYPWICFDFQTESIASRASEPEPIDIPQFIDPTDPSQRIAEAIVAPDDNAWEKVKFKFDVPGYGTLIADFPKNAFSLKSGKQYEYTIAISPNGITIASKNIISWNDGDNNGENNGMAL